jgi:hypothetical protein
MIYLCYFEPGPTGFINAHTRGPPWQDGIQDNFGIRSATSNFFYNAESACRNRLCGTPVCTQVVSTDEYPKDFCVQGIRELAILQSIEQLATLYARKRRPLDASKGQHICQSTNINLLMRSVNAKIDGIKLTRSPPMPNARPSSWPPPLLVKYCRNTLFASCIYAWS